jgi:hypothetical protein
MLRRLFRWIWGEREPRDLHVHVHVHLTQGGISVTPHVSAVTSSKPEHVKHVSHEGATADEVAQVILAGGLSKAIDKSGDAAIQKNEAAGVDDQLGALRRLNKR